MLTDVTSAHDERRARTVLEPTWTGARYLSLMSHYRNQVLALTVLALAAACTSNPSPQVVIPTAASSPTTATPSSSPAISVDCGPLAVDLCAKAAAVAEGTFPATHQSFISVRIESPTPSATCPPSGGPPGSHLCGVIATVITADAAVAVGLVQTPDGWIWSGLIR